MWKHSFGNIKAQLWPQKKRKTTMRKSKNHSFISVFHSNWSIFIDRFCDRFFTFSRHQTSRHAPAVEAWFITFRLAHKDETRHVFPFLLLCLFLWSAYKIGGVELWMPVLLARNVMNHALRPTPCLIQSIYGSAIFILTACNFQRKRLYSADDVLH